MGQLSRRISALFIVCFAAIAGLMLAASGYFWAIGFGVVLVWLFRKRTVPHFTLWLFFGGLLLRLAVVLILHPPLASDFQALYEAAQSMLVGDFSFQYTSYFSLWSYQSVFVAWESMWLWLWNNAVCLKIVNAVLASATLVLLYRMLRRQVHRKAAQFAMVWLTCFPFALTLPTLLSNQIPSAFFLTLGLWLLLCQDCRRLRFWRYPLAGLALQLGNLLRSEGVIFLVAILAWAVFRCLRRRRGQSKRLVAGMVALLCVYAGVHTAADTLVRASGLNAYGIQNGDPAWKFVTGLNYGAAGGYSDEDWNRIAPTLDENHQITPQTVAVQNEMIVERLQKPVRLVRHLLNKIRILWCRDALYWAFAHTQTYNTAPMGLLSRAAIYDLLGQADRGFFYIALCAALLGLMPNWRRRACSRLQEQIEGQRSLPLERKKRRVLLVQDPVEKLVPYFVVFAAFCAFLAVEVQARYAYLPQLYLFAAAAYGFDRLGVGHDEI